MKQPVTVKAYGLIPFTKNTYIITQAIVFGVGIPFAFILAYVIAHTPFREFIPAIIILFAIALVGETIETILMMRKFRQKERTARASS